MQGKNGKLHTPKRGFLLFFLCETYLWIFIQGYYFTQILHRMHFEFYGYLQTVTVKFFCLSFAVCAKKSISLRNNFIHIF